MEDNATHKYHLRLFFTRLHRFHLTRGKPYEPRCFVRTGKELCARCDGSLMVVVGCRHCDASGLALSTSRSVRCEMSSTVPQPCCIPVYTPAGKHGDVASLPLPLGLGIARPGWYSHSLVCTASIMAPQLSIA
eukprot:7365739-Pyramimonas_sp.AAC.1